MMGMGVNSAGAAMNFQQQDQNAPYQNPFQQQAPQQQAQPVQQQAPSPQQQVPEQQAPQQPAEPSGAAKLAEFKQMLDQGLITQEDYDAAKRRALGLD